MANDMLRQTAAEHLSARARRLRHASLTRVGGPPRRPSRRSGGVTGQCHDPSLWASYAAFERAEKAIGDFDAEIRTVRALLTYATGEVGGVD